ncbi:hypothetical protein EV182_005369 [Spiromyces aspiralis]|uniref:Uncharacterized protein n=1 Tax=Spiromyces aspiralis TaxID=68401 RepID=A0ACC1HQ67_9FUNG|nr:hypothetical protein EV182_005369 [Spiromyces aspiralis]
MTPDGRFVPYLCDYSPLSQLLSSEDYNKWISQSNQALSDVIPTRQLSHKSLGDDCPEFFTTAAAARNNVHNLKEKPIRLTVGARTRPSINSNLFFST